jgi:hypothetical protein
VRPFSLRAENFCWLMFKHGQHVLANTKSKQSDGGVCPFQGVQPPEENGPRAYQSLESKTRRQSGYLETCLETLLGVVEKTFDLVCFAGLLENSGI